MEIVLRPLVMLALLLIAFCISRALYRFIPDGKVKRWLYKQHHVIPRANDQ